MEKEYIRLWESYLDYFQPLSDAEVGRLVLGMLQYKSTGAEPEFSGNERFVWPAIRRDINGTIQSLKEFSEKQSENGKKGGRPKKNGCEGKPTETQKTQAFSEKAKKAKEKEKEKVMDKDNPPHTPQRGDEAAELWEKFWAAYPRKQAKEAAKKAWDKLKPTKENLAIMLSALSKQKRSSQWTRDNGQYIPYPATWLNGRRWEDAVQDAGSVAQGRGTSYDLDEIERMITDGPSLYDPGDPAE